MKKIVNRYRQKTRGHPAASATCARDVEIPLSSESGHSDGGLFVLEDVITSGGKRVVAITSDICMSALNQKHGVIHIDGTFRTYPKHFTPLSAFHEFLYIYIFNDKYPCTQVK